MSNMTFRLAMPEDMPEIMRVIHEAQVFMGGLGIDQWQDGYPEPEMMERDIELGQLYVYADGERVGAVAALSLLPEPVYETIEDGAWQSYGPYLTIHRMALDDASRGSGLARRMLAWAVEIARKNDCGAIRIDTHRGNVAMRRFLAKNGFEYRGIVYYDISPGDPVRVAYEKLM